MSSVRTLSIRSVLVLSLSTTLFVGVCAAFPPPSDTKADAPSAAGEIPFMGKPSESLPEDEKGITGKDALERVTPTASDSARPTAELSDIKPVSPVIDEQAPAQLQAVRATEERLRRGLQLMGGAFVLIMLVGGAWYWRRSGTFAGQSPNA